MPGLQEADEQSNERTRAAEWMRKMWRTDPHCAVCGSANWQIGDVYELRAFRGGAFVIGGVPIFPVFPVTCDTCGNTLFINAVRSGVVASETATNVAEGSQSAVEAVGEAPTLESRSAQTMDEEIRTGE